LQAERAQRAAATRRIGRRLGLELIEPDSGAAPVERVLQRLEHVDDGTLAAAGGGR
jgi:hypothetical protein